MKSLEQELGQMVAAQGYSVRFHDSGFLHVYVYYENVQIDHKLFCRPWRWRKAVRYVKRTLREHQKMRRELEGLL